jgi:hypothetical protein
VRQQRRVKRRATDLGGLGALLSAPSAQARREGGAA